MPGEFIARNGMISRGNVVVTGSLTTSGSLTATGTITATTLVVQTITSSISSITGSTNFGTLSSNTHTFTGSINASGSATFAGNVNINGEILTIGGTSNNAIINNIASIRVNVDSDNTGTGESFTIGHNQTAINDSNVLFRVQDNGNVGIGTSSPTQILDVFGPRVRMGDGGGFELNFNTTTFAAFQLNGSERMRITSGGYTKMSNDGTYINATGPYHEMRTTSSNNEVVVLRNTSASPYGYTLQFSGASPNGGSNWFMYCEDSTAQRFSVRSNGGVYNYSANNVNLSDISTKKDIIPCESYWNKFKAIEIVKFKYIDQSHDDYNIGVIAQQVEQVAPEFIDEENWGKEDEDAKIMKAVYTEDLHHATIKVLQEAMAKIEQLEAKVIELENK